jgi:hypothetical protein
MANGPAPKPAGKRQRRNRSASAATIETSERAVDKAPPLGPHPDSGEKWHRRTREFWRDVWASPMVGEYLKADTNALLMLAVLVDRFWKKPDATLAAEVRRQREAFGLTPIDRRRLQWEIVRTEEAEKKRRSRPAAPTPATDPRQALRAV